MIKVILQTESYTLSFYLEEAGSYMSFGGGRILHEFGGGGILHEL